jgi:hypothetical protein
MMGSRGGSAARMKQLKEEEVMTEKAQTVLNRLKVRRLFRNAERRNEILNEFNRDNLDDVGPIGVARTVPIRMPSIVSGQTVPPPPGTMDAGARRFEQATLRG